MSASIDYRRDSSWGLATLSTKRQLLGLLGWLALVFVVAAIGAVASINAAGFYAGLDRPSWSPPASVFGPVWSVLYLLMGIAAWLVWRQRGGFREARGALVLFIVQLVFNALWSWLFFAWHQGGLALADIAVLWVLIVATIVSFWRIKPIAAVLLIPYWLWVSFAAVLNYSVWRLNPEMLG